MLYVHADKLLNIVCCYVVAALTGKLYHEVVVYMYSMYYSCDPCELLSQVQSSQQLKLGHNNNVGRPDLR